MKKIKTKIKFFIAGSIGIAIIIGFLVITGFLNNNSGNGDGLAKCLTEKGAKMYGAYWCPHCKNQKEDFGSSFKYIDYIECDSKGENANPLACQNAGIAGYPTWIINGNKYPGKQSLDNLKLLAGC